jgi:hypothetical protein
MSGHKKTAAELLPSPDQERVDENIETKILEDWSQYVQGKLLFFPIEKYETMEISDSIQYIFNTYKTTLYDLELIESNELKLKNVLDILERLDVSQHEFQGTVKNKNFLIKLIEATYPPFFIKFIVEPLCLLDNGIELFLMDVKKQLHEYYNYIENDIVYLTWIIIEQIDGKLGDTPDYEINDDDDVLYKINIDLMYNIITNNSDIREGSVPNTPTVIDYIKHFENIYYSGWIIYTWNKILDGTFNEKSVFNYLNTHFDTIPSKINILYQMLNPDDYKNYSPRNLVKNISRNINNINVYMPSKVPHSYHDDLIYLTLRNIAKYEGKLIGKAWWLYKGIEPKAYPFGEDPYDKKLIKDHIVGLKILLQIQIDAGHFTTTAKQINDTITFLDKIVNTY